MRRITEPKLIVGFVLISGILCVNAIVLTSNMRTVTRNRQNVERSHEVTEALESVFSTVKDAETGQRGFLLTNEKEYLAPYTKARETINLRLGQLINFAKDDPAQRRSVAELERYVGAKLSELDETVKLEQAGRSSESITMVFSDRGRTEMDAIRAQVARMESAERTELLRQERESAASEEKTRATFAGATIASLILLTIVCRVTLRSIEERQRAANALQRAITETNHRVKNNLQLISAMVELHALEGDDTLSAKEVQRLGTNISTLAAVQDVLTKASKLGGDSSEVSTKEILEQLLPTHQLSAPHHTITAQLVDIRLPGAQATALALLANELLANAIKHGKGAVHLMMETDANGTILDMYVTDNGPGFAIGFDPVQAANTGLELIVNLAKWDLRGELSFGNHANGGEVHLRMPLGETTKGAGIKGLGVG